MLWQYNLDKYFDLTFEENRSLLSSMTAKTSFKMLMKSPVDHLISVFKKLQRGLDLKNFKFATAHFSMDAICRTDTLYVTNSQAYFCSALVSINPVGDTLLDAHARKHSVLTILLLFSSVEQKVTVCSRKPLSSTADYDLNTINLVRIFF